MISTVQGARLQPIVYSAIGYVRFAHGADNAVSTVELRTMYGLLIAAFFGALVYYTGTVLVTISFVIAEVSRASMLFFSVQP